MRRLQLGIEFVAAVAEAGKFPALGAPEVALVGRSNVGKSSFLNALAGGRSVARISRWPGRTRTVNLYRTERMVIADLPGYGFARVSKEERNRWKTVVESYLARSAVRLVVLLVDCRVGATPLDRTMSEWLQARRLPRIVVLSKVDRLARGGWKAVVDAAAEALAVRAGEVFPVSAVTLEGVTEAWKAIEQRIP